MFGSHYDTLISLGKCLIHDSCFLATTIEPVIATFPRGVTQQ